jgi:Protein of unknown function (DUF2380)
MANANFSLSLAAGFLIALAAVQIVRAAAAALGETAQTPTIAVFPIEVADTSGEPPNPQWPERVTAVTAELAQQLQASGKYRVVDLAPVHERLATVAPVYRCQGCWRDLARAVGAETVAIAVVHKISTLISSLHVWLLDVETQQLIRQGAVSLRGDTEEAWRRAVGFLLRRGILREGDGPRMLSSPFPGG